MSDSSPPPVPGEQPSDCFAPPPVPCECFCLHCQRVFMSDGIWFQKVINARDGFDGFWMCPTPNCDGAGFTFDIFPTDPAHPANQGWTEDEDGEFIDLDEEDAELGSPGEFNPGEPDASESDVSEYDPAEPAYAEWDEHGSNDDDDLEGEEWKHGLAPGERPPHPPAAENVRREWEQQQQRYDAPDKRPRIIDWSDRPAPPHRSSGSESSDGNINENDIPF